MTTDIEKILHKCFHPKEGKPGLYKVSVNIEKAMRHMDKAQKNLRAMKVMFDNDLFERKCWHNDKKRAGYP